MEEVVSSNLTRSTKTLSRAHADRLRVLLHLHDPPLNGISELVQFLLDIAQLRIRYSANRQDERPGLLLENLCQRCRLPQGCFIVPLQDGKVIVCFSTDD